MKTLLSNSEIGDEHALFSLKTPLKANAFDLSNEDKMLKIEYHFREIMEALGLDLSDDSLKGTPERVAKMYINEIYSGLDPRNKPKISVFNNTYNYGQMLIEKDITVYSNCEHHFVPIIGKAHVAYIPSKKIIGLSKLNRIVEYYCKRPQVQERLTNQIADEIKTALNSEDVAVLIEAKHLCVSMRGVKDDSSSTITSYFGGAFKSEGLKQQFISYIN